MRIFVTGASGHNGGPRIDAANSTLSLAQRGVRSSVVRLAPMVHSDLDLHGFTSALVGFARDSGAAAYIGDVGRPPTRTTSVCSTAWRSKRRPPARPSTVRVIWGSRSR